MPRTDVEDLSLTVGRPRMKERTIVHLIRTSSPSYKGRRITQAFSAGIHP